MPASSGSVITRTLRAPRSARSMPTSRVTPGPKRILDAAISKAISFFIPEVMLQQTNVGRDLAVNQACTVAPDGAGHLQQIIGTLLGIQYERGERWAQFQQRDQLAGGKSISFSAVQRDDAHHAS